MIASIDSANGSVLSLLHFLVVTYFSNENYCNVIYYDRQLTTGQNTCNAYCEFLGDLEQIIASQNLQAIWITSGSDWDKKHVRAAFDLGCQSYITITANVTAFLEMKLTIKDSSMQRNRDRNFLIFSEDVPSLANNWVTKQSLQFYPNLWFMVPSTLGGYEFYTQNFTKFNDFNLYHVNSYDLANSTFATTSDLFADKIVDLGGRIVTASIIDYVPYCMSSYVGPGKGNVDAYDSPLSKELQVEGMDGILIVEFCKLRHCEIKLKNMGPDNWGEIFPNGSGYGLSHATYSRQTEFSVCDMSYTWVSDYLDCSSPIGQMAVSLLVPRAKVLPRFLTPIYPFDPTLWIAVFIMLIILTGVHFVMSILDSTVNNVVHPASEYSILVVMSMYMDQPIHLNSSSSSYRLLIMFILLSGVVLSNSYDGGFASALTIPRYEKSLETVHNFAQSPFYWAAPSLAWTYSIQESADSAVVKRKFIEIPDLDEIYRRTHGEDLAIAIELLNSQKINAGTYIREDNVYFFEALKEMLFTDYTEVVSQRGWPIIDHFSKFILEVVQHGLTLHWEMQMLRKYKSNQLVGALEQLFSGYRAEEELQSLSVEHISGALILLGMGVGVASGVFVGEWLWYWLSGLVWRRNLVVAFGED